VTPGSIVRDLSVTVVTSVGYEHSPERLSIGTVSAGETREFDVRVRPCRSVDRRVSFFFRGETRERGEYCPSDRGLAIDLELAASGRDGSGDGVSADEFADNRSLGDDSG